MTPLLPESRASSSGIWLRLQRERALVALFELDRQKSAGFRVARLYSWGVFAGYALAICLTRGAARAFAIHGFVRAALISLSWVVGALAALASARALAEQPERDALAALAIQRGFARSAFVRARVWATTRRVARLVGMPALLLVAVGVARGGSLPWALSVAPAVVVYALTLGFALALLALFSAELSPRHPRALLSTLVLAPLLISLVFPELPSVPRLFSGLLAQLFAAGLALS